jgi:hypothetical protein
MTTTPIRTADQILDLLTDIAETGSAIPPVIVRKLAWPGHDAESLSLAWMDFREAVRARGAMLGEPCLARDWRDLYDYPEVGSLDEALNLKSGEIDDAYRTLVNGPRGGAQ